MFGSTLERTRARSRSSQAGTFAAITKGSIQSKLHQAASVTPEMGDGRWEGVVGVEGPGRMSALYVNKGEMRRDRHGSDTNGTLIYLDRRSPQTQPHMTGK